MRSKYEVKAQKELEAEGYLVDNKSGMGRWSKNRDFWNLYDLVAYKPHQIRYISIKGHIGGSLRTAHTAELSKMVFPKGCTNEFWEFPNTKKKEWVKRILKEGKN